ILRLQPLHGRMYLRERVHQRAGSRGRLLFLQDLPAQLDALIADVDATRPSDQPVHALLALATEGALIRPTTLLRVCHRPFLPCSRLWSAVSPASSGLGCACSRTSCASPMVSCALARRPIGPSPECCSLETPRPSLPARTLARYSSSQAAVVSRTRG